MDRIEELESEILYDVAQGVVRDQDEHVAHGDIFLRG
jgi:hypothetical protein